MVGDHSGFVGSGLGTAIGASLANRGASVWCLCGDQGFANGLTALLSGVDNKVDINVIVWNNGGSESLRKQGRKASYWSEELQLVLKNGDSQAADVAAGIGCIARQVDFLVDPECAPDRLSRALGEMVGTQRSPGPNLLEIVAPVEPEVWSDVWRTTGFDQS